MTDAAAPRSPRSPRSPRCTCHKTLAEQCPTHASYSDRVAYCDDPAPCRHGHLGCSLHEGGPCSDELSANAQEG